MAAPFGVATFYFYVAITNKTPTRCEFIDAVFEKMEVNFLSIKTQL